MKPDLGALALYRRGACLPRCPDTGLPGRCPRGLLTVVKTERQEWLRARTRYRLQCSFCGRWGAKFVPARFIEEGE